MSDYVKLLQVCCVVAALPLAACSTGLLGGGGSEPVPDQRIQVNNQLALPPDLSLAAPGTRPQPKYQTTSLEPPARKTKAPAAPADNIYGNETAARAPAVDVYEKYGISKLNPDGTPKDQGKLSAELRAAVLAEKRKTNPNYGTIRNIGELFRDQ